METLSPAVTLSPNISTAAVVPDSLEPGSAGRPTDRQTPEGGGTDRPAQHQHQQRQRQKRNPPGEDQGPQAQEQPPPAQRRRNRAAATKCRAKAKLAAADLEASERAMSSEHHRLSAMARDLRDELLQLKHELLAHGKCGDVHIQQYLARQARVVVNGTLQ
ncbi:putative transcription factor atf21 [Diaporthe ampelina]|uniref:Putative transcription factor atf21 n=1 Tax=Diaporthe ampelina TaxID=1214573 RepID=A0A0G2HXS4_9PEZI|nr:putative transcription factor atf21 [Diaporthe ampelina]